MREHTQEHLGRSDAQAEDSDICLSADLGVAVASRCAGSALWLSAIEARGRGSKAHAERLCQSLLGLTRIRYGLDLEDVPAVLARSRQTLDGDNLPAWLGRTLFLLGLIAQDQMAPADRQIELFRAAIEVLHAELNEGAEAEQDIVIQIAAAKTALVQAAALRRASVSELADPLPNYLLRHPGPLAGKDLCLLTIYAPRGQVSGITTDYLNLMAQHGFAVIACLAVEDVAAPVDLAALTSAAGVLVRKNGGMDFACWSAALALLPEIWTASRVVFTNDSIIALPAIFSPFADRLRASLADFTGLTEALRPRHHIQSYFFMLQGKALVDPIVQKFWMTLPVLDRKSDIIEQYETRLLERAVKLWRLKCEILFSGPTLGLAPKVNDWEHNNLSHSHWEQLIEAGMPFVKVELLRDNPLGLEISHWREVLGAKGVDCSKAEAHFAIKRSAGPRRKPQKSKVMALLSKMNHLRLRLHRKLRRRPRRLV